MSLNTRNPLGRALKPALVAAALAALGVALPATAGAAPTLDGEFDLGGATPSQLTQGPDNNIWVSLSGSTDDFAKVTPDGTVTAYDAADVAAPVGITRGPDNNLWVTQAGGVAKIDPANPTGATKYAIAAIADPRAITNGPDGNLWTASGDKVIKIPPADPTAFTAYTVAGMGARGIARGNDGNLWVVDFAGQRIVSVTTDGVPTPYPVGGGPQEVAAGFGNQVVYSNPGAMPQNVGRILPGGTPETTNTPDTDPFGIAWAPDGAYWVANFASDTMTRLTPAGAASSFPMPAGSGPRYVTTGPGNTLWVGLEKTKKIARISGVTPENNGGGGNGGGGGGNGGGGGGNNGGGTVTVSQPIAIPGAVRIGRQVTVRWSQSASATTRIQVQKRMAGKRSRGRCVKPRRSLRRNRNCVRWVTLTTLNRPGRAGANTLRFRRKLGSRTLSTGTYRLVIAARDAGGRLGGAKVVQFRLKR
jgi:streptogramin lyase